MDGVVERLLDSLQATRHIKAQQLPAWLSSHSPQLSFGKSEPGQCRKQEQVNVVSARACQGGHCCPSIAALHPTSCMEAIVSTVFAALAQCDENQYLPRSLESRCHLALGMTAGKSPMLV